MCWSSTPRSCRVWSSSATGCRSSTSSSRDEAGELDLAVAGAGDPGFGGPLRRHGGGLVDLGHDRSGQGRDAEPQRLVARRRERGDHLGRARGRRALLLPADAQLGRVGGGRVPGARLRAAVRPRPALLGAGLLGPRPLLRRHADLHARRHAHVSLAPARAARRRRQPGAGRLVHPDARGRCSIRSSGGSGSSRSTRATARARCSGSSRGSTTARRQLEPRTPQGSRCRARRAPARRRRSRGGGRRRRGDLRAADRAVCAVQRLLQRRRRRRCAPFATSGTTPATWAGATKQGEYFFFDRKADYIRYKGRSVSSFAVEAAVTAHPAVVECAAYGVTSAELESEAEIKVDVVLQPGALREARRAGPFRQRQRALLLRAPLHRARRRAAAHADRAGCRSTSCASAASPTRHGTVTPSASWWSGERAVRGVGERSSRSSRRRSARWPTPRPRPAVGEDEIAAVTAEVRTLASRLASERHTGPYSGLHGRELDLSTPAGPLPAQPGDRRLQPVGARRSPALRSGPRARECAPHPPPRGPAGRGPRWGGGDDRRPVGGGDAVRARSDVRHPLDDGSVSPPLPLAPGTGRSRRGASRCPTTDGASVVHDLCRRRGRARGGGGDGRGDARDPPGAATMITDEASPALRAPDRHRRAAPAAAALPAAQRGRVPARGRGLRRRQPALVRPRLRRRPPGGAG